MRSAPEVKGDGMKTQEKRELMEKVRLIANRLAFEDLNRLTTGADEHERDMAQVLGNAIDQLRVFQHQLARRILREENEERDG
jgi:hypothetical protein